MKFLSLLSTSILTTICIASCTPANEMIDAKEHIVLLNATAAICSEELSQQINHQISVENVGLYMIEAGVNSAIVADVYNKNYSIIANGALQPINGEHAYYPNNGSKVKFISYYPFNTNVDDTIYPIDLEDENIINHDFYYASTGNYDKEHLKPVDLYFQRQLGQLAITLEENNGAPILDANISIEGPTKARFDLRSGTLEIDTDHIARIPLTVAGNQAQTIVLPGKMGSIYVNHRDKNYQWNISDVEIIPDKICQIVLKIENNVSDVTVEDWVHVNGGIITPQPNVNNDC